MTTFTDTYKPLSCTLGTDPEIFAVDGKKRLLPAFSFAPHRRESPSLYWDGFALEGNTPPRDSLYHLVREVAGLLQRFAGLAKQAGGQLTLQNAFRVPAKTLKEAGDEQVALGCMPSFNAYGLVGDIHSDSRALRDRFAGGHIHIGNNAALTSLQVAVEAVKAMDAVVGVASVALAAGLDQPIRRKFYGLAGEFRRPPHGIEYRVLSNFWLVSPATTFLVFNLAKKGFELGVRGLRSELDGREEEVRDIIQSSDVTAARAFLRRNHAFFNWCLLSTSPTLVSGHSASLNEGVLSRYNPKYASLLSFWEEERWLWQN